MPTFYGVFGQESFHPVTGQNLAFSYVEIEAATMRDAHAIMWANFGSGWRDVDEVKPVRDEYTPGNAQFTRIPLPEPVMPPGQTVTLRVRITEGMAKENALFVAGRCVAFRPGSEGVKTRHGLAVWPENNVWPPSWKPNAAPGIGGAGEVLLVRYVPAARAAAATAADPANVSIVEDSESLACVGVRPDTSNGPREISGLFTSEMLEAFSSWGAAYKDLAREAYAALERAEELKNWRDSVVGVDIRNGRVVGVRMTSR